MKDKHPFDEIIDAGRRRMLRSLKEESRVAVVAYSIASSLHFSLFRPDQHQAIMLYSLDERAAFEARWVQEQLRSGDRYDFAYPVDLGYAGALSARLRTLVGNDRASFIDSLRYSRSECPREIFGPRQTPLPRIRNPFRV